MIPISDKVVPIYIKTIYAERIVLVSNHVDFRCWQRRIFRAVEHEPKGYDPHLVN